MIIQDYRAQARSLAEHSSSPVAFRDHTGSSVRQSIPEEPEPDENSDEEEPLTMSYFLPAKHHQDSQPETPVPPPPIPVIVDDNGPVPPAVPRPRKVSQHPDPFATFSRRSSAIFAASHSPAASTVGVAASNISSLAHFPVIDDNDEATPSAVAIPVRSRLPSMIDGSQFRHLRTLSTVSIHETGARPGGLAAIAPIGKYVGAKTGGADAPPSSPPTELR